MRNKGTRIPGNFTIADLHISSAREEDGTFVVALQHDAMPQPAKFTIAGARAIAIRLAAACECAMRGVNANPRVFSKDESDLQSLVNIESFQCGQGPSVQMDIGAFQVRITAVGALRIAARLAYCSELARTGIEHPMTENELSEEYLEAAQIMLMSTATACLVRGREIQKESKGHDPES